MRLVPIAKELSTTILNTAGTAINPAGSKGSAFTPAVVSVDNTAGGTIIIAANATRNAVIIQNCGVVAVTLGTVFGTGIILKACTAVNDGTGGLAVIDNTTAAIKGITSAVACNVSVVEM